MKELSIEEKAKRYDEAVAMAKECITYIPDEAVNKYMLNMFPELKEDEDEEIRKRLINLIYKVDRNTDYINLVERQKMLAWLEKQREQKPTWSEEDERMFHTIIADFKGFKHDNTSCLAPHFDECIAWLNSIKERYTWKPTKEQVNAIRLARSFVTDDFTDNPTLSEILLELEELLKKIMEG